MFAITLKFLEAVEANNTTERLHSNYDLYQQERKRFENLISELLSFAKTINPHRSDLTAKGAIFRFNRDIRYRVDKRPYKNHFGAEFAFDGRRSGYPCFYFHLQPRASFVGIGTRRVGNFLESQMRKYAMLHFAEWKKLQKWSAFTSYYGSILDDAEEQYKSMYCIKKAFPEADPEIAQLSPERQELRMSKCSFGKAQEIIHSLPKKEQQYYHQLCFMKNWLREKRISDELLLSDQLFLELKKALEIATPMLTFLQKGCSL